MRRILLTAASLLGLTGLSPAADPVTIASTRDGDLAAIRSLLPADHPEGVKATVTLVSLKRAPSPYDPTLSAFIVDYAPGGSAVLHHAPASGYVLVHVLSGAIRAQAWGAGIITEGDGIAWEAHLGGFYSGLLLYGLFERMPPAGAGTARDAAPAC